MGFHWIFEVHGKFSPLWMEWLSSPSTLCPLLHQFISQIFVQLLCASPLVVLHSTRPALVQRLERNPYADFWVLSILPAPLFPVSATQIPAISSALNFSLPHQRQTSGFCWIRPTCTTVGKVPQGRKLGLMWSSLHVFLPSRITALSCLFTSSLSVCSSFIVVYIRRISPK